MIFLYVGLAILSIIFFIYALIKWIIPWIIKLVKQAKEKNRKKAEKKHEEEPQVSLAVKGEHAEEVSYGDTYKEVAYIPEEQKHEEESVENEAKHDENEEFQQFLKDFKENKETDIKTQIKTSSPKLKAILMSGALQDKKYKD